MLQRLEKADSPAALTEQALRERDLIAVVAGLVRELHPQRIRFIDVLPSSRIERDLESGLAGHALAPGISLSSYIVHGPGC